jgi:IS1 family transposase
VVKRREHGRVVAVTRTIIGGEADEMKARLAASTTRTTLKTRLVERDNLTGRAHKRRLTRTTLGFATALPGMDKQVGLSLAY